MQRPEFITAFLGLLGGVNLVALVAGLSKLTVDPVTATGLYGGVAVGCFAVLIYRRLRRSA